jgi:UDP-N-acetylglucosamine 2-epimerase (non-hydrolysing)
VLLIAYGTRPELVKLRPVLPLLEGRVVYRLLFTGQHSALDGERCDIALEIADDGHRLDAVLRSIVAVDAGAFGGIRAVLVQGDTASAFGMALAAFHRHIPVIHLEAGLRTHDLANPFPEEMYRQQISRLTALHLCPTSHNRDNLVAEGCPGRKEVVGNTVLDNLVGLMPSDGGPVIITLHRRENQAQAVAWMNAFDALAAAYPELEFIFVRHPAPDWLWTRHALRQVKVIDPLPHDIMARSLAACRLVVTDSGGLQEEGSFLGKRVIVCRRTTERPESLGTHSALCVEPGDLAGRFADALAQPRPTAPCPFGDGRSAPRVAGLIQEMLASRIESDRPD